jgi:hypothetical protein
MKISFNKENKILIRIFFLMSYLFLSLSPSSFSQVIQELTVPTNFRGNQANNYFPAFGLRLDIIDDSVLFVPGLVLGDSINRVSVVTELVIDISSFTIIRQDTVWTRGNKHLSVGLFNESGFGVFRFTDNFNGNNYLLEAEGFPGDTVFEFQLYNANSNFSKGALAFNRIFTNVKVQGGPLIYGNSIYVYLLELNGGFGRIERLDLSGNLLTSRTIDFSNYDITKDFNINRHGGIQIYQPNDSFITSGFFGGYELVRLNRFNLETNALVGISQSIGATLFNNRDYRGARTYEYTVDASGVEMDGAVASGSGFTAPWDFQYFTCKVGWDSTLIFYNSFGDTLVDEVITAFERVGKKKYFTGTTNYSSLDYAYGQFYRAVPIIIADSTGILDSISIYGQKNHKVTDLKIDKNQNLLIRSYFSNAWSDDSIFLQLTKIPIGILTSIREQKLSRNVAIYPNPTRDFIYSDEFENGDVVQIFNQQGQLLKEERISFSNGIDVRFLRTGTYFFQLIRENERQTVLFIKTE